MRRNYKGLYQEDAGDKRNFAMEQQARRLRHMQCVPLQKAQQTWQTELIRAVLEHTGVK